MYESNNLPSHLIEHLNSFKVLWVPNSWNKNNFVECGVTSKIDIVPFGVDHDLFTVKKKSNVFTFLFVGVAIDRKNWKILYEAFKEEFNDQKCVRLIIKFDGKTEINLDKVDNIEVINKVLNDYEMADLYSKSHVIVSPSCAEGIGMPIIEGYASGSKALFTDAPFFNDFDFENYSKRINVSYIGKPSNIFKINSVHAESNFYYIAKEDLKKKMRFLKESETYDMTEYSLIREQSRKFSWRKSVIHAIRSIESL